MLPKFDAESTKTVGLAEAIAAEGRRPRCDVFWNNEILHTLRLKQRGLLEAYVPPIAKSYPAAYRDPQGFWHGFAARARVLVVNTKLVGEKDRPASILDLADPKWRGRAAMAKPLFGTTATQAACLFAVWGDRRAKEFFRAVKRNDVQILSGNKQVALAVAAGRLAFGLTDTDDALIEVEKGMPVAIVYPDQGADGLGTLLIPNTLAIVRGWPHPAAARRLVDYLLSPEVEAGWPPAQAPRFRLNPKAPAARAAEDAAERSRRCRSISPPPPRSGTRRRSSCGMSSPAAEGKTGRQGDREKRRQGDRTRLRAWEHPGSGSVDHGDEHAAGFRRRSGTWMYRDRGPSSGT